MIKIGKDISDWRIHTCQPQTKNELKDIIKERISKDGNDCNLNDIDTSLIIDMSFCSIDQNLMEIFLNGTLQT